MGTTKSEIFSPEQNYLAGLFRALAHPARLAILHHLIVTRECICGDLVEQLGLAQSTISQHLKELKNAGLIHGTIDGVSVCYCIDPVAWVEAKTIIDSLFSSYTPPNTQVCCN